MTPVKTRWRRIYRDWAGSCIFCAHSLPGHICSILGNLSSMATDMGNEIGKQNAQLDNIQGKVQFTLHLYNTGSN